MTDKEIRDKVPGKLFLKPKTKKMKKLSEPGFMGFQDYRILNLAAAAAANLPEGLCSPFLKKFLLKEIIRLVPLFSVDNSDRENYN